MQDEAVDRRRSEADDRVGDAVEALLSGERSSQCSRGVNQRTCERTTISTDDAPSRWAMAALSRPFWPPPRTTTRLPASPPNAPGRPRTRCADRRPRAGASGTRGNGMTPTASTSRRARHLAAGGGRDAEAATAPARRRDVGSGRSPARSARGTSPRSPGRAAAASAPGARRPWRRRSAAACRRRREQESLVSSQCERISMSGGISVRHVCIGWPKVRTRVRGARCAAIERPYGPAPTTATSS